MNLINKILLASIKKVNKMKVKQIKQKIIVMTINRLIMKKSQKNNLKILVLSKIKAIYNNLRFKRIWKLRKTKMIIIMNKMNSINANKMKI